MSGTRLTPRLALLNIDRDVNVGVTEIIGRFSKAKIKIKKLHYNCWFHYT